MLEAPYRLKKIVQETPDVNSFVFEPLQEYNIKFDPGMFVMLQYRGPDEKIARAFSIASSPLEKEMEFIIHMIHGRFTKHLDTAKEGDIYYITGPYGQFRFDPNVNKKVLFIAGGTGIAPFISMLRYIDQMHLDTEIKLLYSVRYVDEIIKRQELDDLTKRIKLDYAVTVTRPNEDRGRGWNGLTGHVDASMIANYAKDVNERTSYICGPLGFVKAVKDALKSLNISEASIKADVWG